MFAFISERLNPLLSQELAASAMYAPFTVDPNALAVAGTSAGGLCAHWAAMHVSPKPKAVVSMYAMGGDFLVSESTSYSCLICPKVYLRHHMG